MAPDLHHPAAGLDPHAWDTGPQDNTCMNPFAVCERCIFHAGHLARWCPPSERAAKASKDTDALKTLILHDLQKPIDSPIEACYL